MRFARTLPAAAGRIAGFSGLLPVQLLALSLLLLSSAACIAPRENNYHRAMRERRLESLEAVRQQQADNRRQLTLAIASDELDLGRLRAAAAAAAQQRRMAQMALTVEQRGVAEKSAEVAALKEQRLALETQLEDVRKLQAELEIRELKLRSLQEQRQALEPQVQAAQAAFDKARAELEPKLAEFQQKLATVRSTDEAVQKALAAIEAAGKVLNPPPPPPEKKK